MATQLSKASTVLTQIRIVTLHGLSPLQLVNLVLQLYWCQSADLAVMPSSTLDWFTMHAASVEEMGMGMVHRVKMDVFQMCSRHQLSLMTAVMCVAAMMIRVLVVTLSHFQNPLLKSVQSVLVRFPFPHLIWVQISFGICPVWWIALVHVLEQPF